MSKPVAIMKFMEYTGERLIIENRECGINSDIYQEHLVRYNFAIKFIKSGDKVLDIACGGGYGSNLLAKQGIRVWAGDADEQSIKIAQRKNNNENLKFKKMDAVKLPFDNNYFDIVVSLETIEHLENYIEFAKELKRVLKVGGKLILSTPNVMATKKLKINNPFHFKEFTQEELLDIFKDFSEIKIYGQRSLEKLSWQNKLWRQIYYIYDKCEWLHFLSKITAENFKKNTGEKISGLEKDFGIKDMKKGREYLYHIIVGVKKEGS